MAGGNVSSTTGTISSDSGNQNHTIPLVVLTTLFFMWGFITCMNDILIPHLKEVFTLSYAQAMLVQSAFFGAFFIVSAIYFVISIISGDPIAKFGYKNAIIVGLLVSAVGCVLFVPAASFESYPFFLGALLILASGITILQMGANPYVSLLGKPETASMRLNLTQAFNSLGTTVAPVVGGVLILGAVTESSGADAVKMPYLGLAGTLLALVVLIAVSKLPRISAGDDNSEDTPKGKGALKYPHLILGVICIFMYVGGEVSVGSAIINYLEKVIGLTTDEAHPYLALFWGGAMVGRFFAAVFLQDSAKDALFFGKIAGFTLFAFGLAWYLTKDMMLASSFLALVVLNIGAFFAGQSKPNRSLGIFALIVIMMILIGVMGSGSIAMWSIIGIGLFNSIMFPTIFTLAIKDLGIDTGQGSSLLVMAIVGGAVIPYIMGEVADSVGIQMALFVPMFCYVYIAYYGFIGSNIRAK